jgi:hypothetical protein
MRLLDTRFQGVAKGVGSAAIMGRIHSAQLKLGQHLILLCSFVVMEMPGIELLFGLDMLRKHQAVLNFGKNCITIHGQDISFLSESECPEFHLDTLTDQSPFLSKDMLHGIERENTHAPNGSSSWEPNEEQVQKLIAFFPQNSRISKSLVVDCLKLTKGNMDEAAAILLGLHS